MKLSSIVHVLLRLFALSWFVTGVVQSVAAFATNDGTPLTVLHFAAPVVLLFVAIMTWTMAPLLSRLLTGRVDTAFPVGSLSLFSLYSTAFVGIGLWFALGSFGKVFNWLHFYVAYGDIPQNQSGVYLGSLYNISESALTLLAGLILVATAPILARKLTKISEQTGAANPHAFGTSGISAAEQPRMPEASGDT